MLLNQQEMEQVLKKVLPQLSQSDIKIAVAALENAMGQWKEVDLAENLGADVSVQCQDICALGAAHHKGCRIRAFILPK